MPEGHLESKRTLSPFRLVLNITLFDCCMLQECFFAFGEYYNEALKVRSFGFMHRACISVTPIWLIS
jgi:hypothetical protein